jgi:hypothetical protein
VIGDLKIRAFGSFGAEEPNRSTNLSRFLAVSAQKLLSFRLKHGKIGVDRAPTVSWSMTSYPCTSRFLNAMACLPALIFRKVSGSF